MVSGMHQAAREETMKESLCPNVYQAAARPMLGKG